MRNLLTGASIALLFGSTAFAAIQEEAVTYKDGDTVMKGFIVYDDASTARRPGVIVVHEWWGITKHVRDEAHKFAGQGYTAFVADMYGDGKTADNPKDAGALSGAVRKDPAAMLSRFSAAKDALSKHATVEASKIGASGYCFGGSVVLDAARAGVDLKGVAAFHAGLGAAATPAAAGKVKAKILVLNGEADPFIKPESIDAFKKEMTAASVDYRYISYPGAVHAFTNPEATEKGKQFNLPLAYHPEADKQAKAEATKFFGSVF
ncbi:dienelactone hydrolase family protein [Rhodoferax sp.]|uniref:dienelactone hydrolase family protein n=1 Tax=Rhodoferax sp. TaxID=50421 RepID=UPI001ECC3841|nr:dienelactone hydrolase family protein [Rhodoferax sp.]MBT9505332.1 dienelactone hydrolase family protein [Rhodoferax sp.]